VGRILAADQAAVERAAAELVRLLHVGPEPVEPPPLVVGEVRG
jgi:hypothetical protein